MSAKKSSDELQGRVVDVPMVSLGRVDVENNDFRRLESKLDKIESEMNVQFQIIKRLIQSYSHR